MVERKIIRDDLKRWAAVGATCHRLQEDLLFYQESLEKLRKSRNQFDEERGLKAHADDGMPKGSGMSDPTAKTAIEICKLMDEQEAHLNREIFNTSVAIQREMEFKTYMDGFINEMPIDCQIIIELKYVRGYNSVRAAREMCLSERQVYRKEEVAVDHIMQISKRRQ